MAIAWVCSAAPIEAQTVSAAGGRNEIFAGSEIETYVRNLEVAGIANPYPWSIRPFSPVEIDHLLASDTAGPWRARYDLGAASGKGLRLSVIPPTVSARFNSGFPYGRNDGPIWAGRGLTTSAQLGLFARLGPLSLTLAPMFFRAENAAFALEPAGVVCPPQCRNGQFPDRVDRPQRFGNTAYQRFDPGQSTFRLDALGASIGVSTANEWWGPAQDFPFLLGNNAPGFLHAFAGTERPVNVLIGHLHARVLYGRLDQSPWSPVTGSKYFVSRAEPGTLRFASGVLAELEPRGLTGLEIGMGRFYHSPWPATGIPGSYYRLPFEALLKKHTINGPQESNQLASFFARWAFPASRFEVYGEYGRDDHNYDTRDLEQEPDHDRAYSFGFRKVFHVEADRLDAVHFELMNYQLPTLVRTGRGEGGIYLNSIERQGHTNRGQLLGSPLGVGSAAGSTLEWDRYSPRGRTTFKWDRTVNQDSGTFYQNGVVNAKSSDVSHALTFERVTFLRAMDLSTGLTLVRDFNRNFTGDAWNLNAIISARFLTP